VPTSPFSSDLIDDLEGRCAWQFYGEIGAIFTPRHFCCTSPNTMGISPGKEPVAIIDLDPNPAFVGETVSYDGTDSYDPDGSIVAYAWTFQGHSPASGTAVSGTLNYGTAGTYNITLTVTDGTSVKSSPARVQLVVNDGELEFYAATAGSGGVFYSDDAGQTYTAYNGSPATGDQAAAFAVVIDPATQHLPAASRTLWRAGQAGTAAGGIFASIDGGATWVTRRPTSVSTSCAASTSARASRRVRFRRRARASIDR
jgi:hypothetical protein